MTNKTPASYDADSLITLDPMAHIQKRPSLYLGTFDHMQLVALREPIDNSIDEFRAGHGKLIRIVLNKDGSAEVQDSGRGVPTSVNKTTGENGIYMAFGKTGSGGKFGAEGSGYGGTASLGLNGVGTTATNATSIRFDTIVYKGNGEIHSLSFKNGKPGHYDGEGAHAKFTPSMDIQVSKDTRTAKEKKERPTGTTIRFWPNPAVFGKDSNFRVDELRETLRSTAFLVKGVHIIIEDHTGTETVVDDFEFDGGITEMLDFFAPDQPLHKVISLEGEGAFKETVPVPQNDGSVKQQEVERAVKVDLALRWGTGYEPTVKSYANTLYTPLNGTHVTGFERALSKVLLDHIKNTRGLLKAKEETPILDDIKEGLTVIVSISQNEPSFIGQDKQRLGGTETQRVVQAVSAQLLKKWVADKKNAATLKLIAQKVVNASRTRIAARQQKEVARKKTALETASSMPEKLVACASDDATLTELQICEGDSALGGLKKSRDSNVTAIYPLKGKPLNTYGLPIGKILQNQEWADLIQIIGAGMGKDFDVDQMRYSKIILLADGDADGSHIRALLITGFWALMRPMVEAGRIYVALPPLFSITTTGKNKERFYALNQEELDALQKKLHKAGKKYDKIQRHKGLGEYSEDILAEVVMEPETRVLKQITVDDVKDFEAILNLAMGSDAKGRRTWITDNRSMISDEELDLGA